MSAAPSTPLSPDAAAFLRCRALVALGGSVFKHPRVWPLVVVMLRDGERPVVRMRAELAAELTASDLPTLAHEATARRVPPGHVLVWIDVDTPDVTEAGFVVVPIARRR